MKNMIEQDFIIINMYNYLDVEQLKYLTNCNTSLNHIVIPLLFEAIINKYDSDWEEISAAIRIKQSVPFIRQYKENICWDFGTWIGSPESYQNLSIGFIREFQDKVDWWDICHYQLLSENVIREFSNRVNWDNISYHQKLSEAFVREFQYKVNWNFIFQRIKLSKDFIIEFIDRVNWNIISSYHSSNKDLIFAYKK